uniref:Uncharacterized protein n=1 Tax=Arundo donax TaxID=35708 RepID=A0A0A9C4Z2_ARUDO
MAVAAVVTDDTALYWPVEIPTAAGAEPPPVSSSQEASTAAPELLDSDPRDQNMAAAAAQVVCGEPEPASDHKLSPLHWQLGAARARCSNRPETRRERPQQGETRVSCW